MQIVCLKNNLRKLRKRKLKAKKTKVRSEENAMQKLRDCIARVKC